MWEQYGPRWSSLRRVAHGAVLEFVRRRQLSTLVADVVDQVVADIKARHGETQFDPCEHIYLTMIQIMATTAFGERYKMDDSELLEIKTAFERQTNIGLLKSMWVALSFIPFFGQLFAKKRAKALENMHFLIKLIRKKFIEKQKQYLENEVNNFGDALIVAKNKVIFIIVIIYIS